MKPSPLLLKAGLVVGLGLWALVPPAATPASATTPCNHISTGLLYCPINPEDYCALYSCPPVEVTCYIDDGEAFVDCGGFT